jgi:putative SOS response-associated peptidase YedK
VIIPPKEYERWMASTDPAHLPVDLLRPYPAEEMRAWKVGKAVGNTRNNDASLIEPLKKNQTIPTTLPLFE